MQKNKALPRSLKIFSAGIQAYTSESEKNDLLFRFVQYVERQVVLFDALEDAAFKDVHDLNGIGTLKHLESEVLDNRKEKELMEKLKDFSVRLGTDSTSDSILSRICIGYHQRSFKSIGRK